MMQFWDRIVPTRCCEREQWGST